MTRDIRLGTVANLEFVADRSALAGSLLLWATLSGLGARLLRLPPTAAVAGGLAATAGHWAAAVAHHLGHAAAAQATGFPMRGVRLWGLLGTSLYPDDERVLSAATHRRRAIGGPSASLAFTVACGVVALALRRRGGLTLHLARFLFLDNLLGFTLGAFLPLGFTDGSTLLRLRGER